MSEELVIVTEYVTVYPSPSANTMLTSPSQLLPSSTPSLVDDLSSAVLSAVSSATARVSMSMSTMSMSSPKATPTSTFVTSYTGISPLPSRTPGAHPEPLGGPSRGPDMAAVSLAALVVMILLLLALFAYAMYSGFRKGKCSPECEDMRAELAKYKTGELKPITPAMVRAREALNAESASAPAPDGDLERGDLAVAPKPSLFTRAKGAFKQRQSTKPQSVHSQHFGASATTVDDRFFTVDDVASTRSPTPGLRQPPPARLPSARYQPTINDADSNYAGPSSRRTSLPSRYSQSTWLGGNDNVSLPDSRQSRASVISSTLNIKDPRHQARYDNAQKIMAAGTAPDHELQAAVNVVNTVEKQKRERIRFGGYGGLPDPREFETILMTDLSKGKGKGKAKADTDDDAYPAPGWRQGD
jgi:hypothetical protein